MDIETWHEENLSNGGGGNGNGPGNTGGNTSGHNATTNSPDAANQKNNNEAQFLFEERLMEPNDKQMMDIEEPLCQFVSQAEYEKVVKGARLTDPVEEPISRSCTYSIRSVCLENDKPLFACNDHIHSVDDNNKETVKKECKCNITKGTEWINLRNLLCVDSIIVLCEFNEPLYIYKYNR